MSFESEMAQEKYIRALTKAQKAVADCDVYEASLPSGGVMYWDEESDKIRSAKNEAISEAQEAFDYLLRLWHKDRLST